MYQVSWHVPDEEELDFALEIFKEIVEPTLERLEHLLEPGMCHNCQRMTQTDELAVAQVFPKMVYGEMTSVGKHGQIFGIPMTQ